MTTDAKLIMEEVCKTLNIPKEKVLSKSRMTEIIDARYLCVYFIKKYTKNTSLKTIGKWFKRVDNGSAHSFTIYALRKTEMWLKVDSDFTNKYNKCTNTLMFYNKDINFNNVPQY